MKKFIFSLTTITLLLVLSTTANSQDYEFVLNWGEWGSGPGQFRLPVGVAVDSYDNVYVVDVANYRIQKFDSNGEYILEWGTFGTEPGQFRSPTGAAVDSANNVYISDYYGCIQKFDSNGGFIAKGTDRLHTPMRVAIDSQDNLFVADYGDNRIKKFDSNLVFISEWIHEEPHQPYGIAVDSNDDVYVIGYCSHILQKFNSNGTLLTQWGGPGCEYGQFGWPQDIVADSDNNIFLVDYSQVAPRCICVQKFTPFGEFITQFGRYGYGDDNLSWAKGIAVDSAGNVYVADFNRSRILKFAPLHSVMPVTIDIKPGENINSINLGSNGNVPVAIFSTEDFDATTVDPISVTLAGASVRIKGKGTPQASFWDVDGDGFLDLIVHVDTTALELTGGDVQAELIGMTFDGQEIRGVDTIRIVNE